MKRFHRSIKSPFYHTIFTLNSSAEGRLKLELAKKDVEFKKVLAKKECDWKDVLAKKDVEFEKVLAKKDVQLAILNEKLKVSNQETLIERQSYSIRAAVETLLLKKYPGQPRKMEEKLQKYWNEDESLKQTYSDLCEKFNCSNYSDKVPSKLYHSLSSQIHGGGYPIQCHIKDSTLSAAEWSFIIAIFKLNLPAKGYSVYDSEENEMDI